MTLLDLDDLYLIWIRVIVGLYSMWVPSSISFVEHGGSQRYFNSIVDPSGDGLRSVLGLCSSTVLVDQIGAVM